MCSVSLWLSNRSESMESAEAGRCGTWDDALATDRVGLGDATWDGADTISCCAGGWPLALGITSDPPASGRGGELTFCSFGGCGEFPLFFLLGDTSRSSGTSCASIAITSGVLDGAGEIDDFCGFLCDLFAVVPIARVAASTRSWARSSSTCNCASLSSLLLLSSVEPTLSELESCVKSDIRSL